MWAPVLYHYLLPQQSLDDLRRNSDQLKRTTRERSSIVGTFGRILLSSFEDCLAGSAYQNWEFTWGQAARESKRQKWGALTLGVAVGKLRATVSKAGRERAHRVVYLVSRHSCTTTQKKDSFLFKRHYERSELRLLKIGTYSKVSLNWMLLRAIPIALVFGLVTANKFSSAKIRVISMRDISYFVSK